jgi:hypothetical protein
MKGIRANLINKEYIKRSNNNINTINSQDYNRNTDNQQTIGNCDAADFRKENQNIQNETKALIEKTKKIINNFNSIDKKESSKIRSNSTGKGPIKQINYEEAIRIKTKSPSPSNETRGVLEKYNNSLINSQSNLKSKY